MLRDFIAALVLSLISVSAFAAADANELTGNTLIKGDFVTVGDLFTNAGRNADHVLAPAPEVGKPLILSKDDLQRVADAFHLDWNASDDTQSVSLSRDAVAITKEDIADALAKSELKDKVTLDASFDVHDFAKPIVLDGQAVPELAIGDVSFDPSTEKFSATLHISRNGQPVKDVPISGLATAMAHIPVLLAPMGVGGVISRADIKELSIPRRDVRPDTILTAEEILGQMPKRTLSANQQVNRSDVTPPLMVKRNEMINVTYHNGPIVLNTKARAMSNGTRGDTVTLFNPSSKKSFDAKITGPQQAEVTIEDING